jgi:hypothetical protein
MNKLLLAAFLLSSFCTLVQCSKKETALTGTTVTEKFSYGDSVFYLKPGGESYTKLPLVHREGRYTAVPDNLKINEKTGEITVAVQGENSTSQTGLWYKIYFESNMGRKDSTMVLISGVNYVDEFYEYKKNGGGDTIISPVYNGKYGERLPKGTFRIVQNDFASIINPANGDINISKFFAAAKKAWQNNSDATWEFVTVRYQLEDKSEKATNEVDVLLYHYYTQRDSVPANVTEVMNIHRSQTFGLNLAPLMLTRGPAEALPSALFGSGGRSLKPRPPCVVIVGN